MFATATASCTIQVQDVLVVSKLLQVAVMQAAAYFANYFNKGEAGSSNLEYVLARHLAQTSTLVLPDFPHAEELNEPAADCMRDKLSNVSRAF